MTREQANARLAAIKLEIQTLISEQEEIAIEHNLVVNGFDEDASARFFPNVEVMKDYYGFDDEDAESVLDENGIDLPAWVSSSAMC